MLERIFGAKTVCIVLGFYKPAGHVRMAGKFLGCFAHKRTARTFAAQAKLDGFEGTRFAEVRVVELEPQL